MRLGGCGSGKMSQGKDGVRFQMPLGDKTWIEVACGGSDEDDVSKFKSGTMYMMSKELSKSLTCPLTMTGFKVEPKADGSQGHGFSLTHESDWCFLPKRCVKSQKRMPKRCVKSGHQATFAATWQELDLRL